MDTNEALLTIAVVVFVGVMCAVLIYSSWEPMMRQMNDGYWIYENNTDYLQIRVYDDRGDSKVQELLGEGYEMIGVSRSNDFTLARKDRGP